MVDLHSEALQDSITAGFVGSTQIRVPIVMQAVSNRPWCPKTAQGIPPSVLKGTLWQTNIAMERHIQ